MPSNKRKKSKPIPDVQPRSAEEVEKELFSMLKLWLTIWEIRANTAAEKAVSLVAEGRDPKDWLVVDYTIKSETVLAFCIQLARTIRMFNRNFTDLETVDEAAIHQKYADLREKIIEGAEKYYDFQVNGDVIYQISGIRNVPDKRTWYPPGKKPEETINAKRKD